jgi:sterol desaturase/sphingolipid hydroxylase (fatty acid hydroxylase superfamily)
MIGMIGMIGIQTSLLWVGVYWTSVKLIEMLVENVDLNQSRKQPSIENAHQVSLTNQILTVIPSISIATTYFFQNNSNFDDEISVACIMKCIFGCALFGDVLFYSIHRLCHKSRFLYENVHRHHHEFFYSYASAALYTDVTEMLIVNIPSVIIPFCISSSYFLSADSYHDKLIALYLWIVMSAIESVTSHSRELQLKMPHFLQSNHYKHHALVHGYYGSSLGIMDRIFG